MQKLTRSDAKGKKVVFAHAYERQRPQSSTVADQEVAWTERVQVIRSLELAKRQAKQLDERLREAVAALQKLTPPVGRGHKQYREEEALRAAVTAIQEERRVVGLLIDPGCALRNDRAHIRLFNTRDESELRGLIVNLDRYIPRQLGDIVASLVRCSIL